MMENADVSRRFAADYVSAHGTFMLPSHRRAIDDMVDCRTAALAGQPTIHERCRRLFGRADRRFVRRSS